MGTRGALGFKYKDKYYITYNHFDSYPGGLGADVVDFIQHIKKQNKENYLDILKKNVSKLKLVDGHTSQPTEKERKMYYSYLNTGVGEKTEKDWYCLLHDIQGIETLFAIYEGKLKHMIDSLNFLKDGLFCEYAYIINIDTEKLEFYEGFQHNQQENNPLPFENIANGSGYYPVAFQGSCSLKRIPKDWTGKFYPSEEDDE